MTVEGLEHKKLSRAITAGALASVFMLTSAAAASASTSGNEPTEEGLQEMLDALEEDGTPEPEQGASSITAEEVEALREAGIPESDASSISWQEVEALRELEQDFSTITPEQFEEVRQQASSSVPVENYQEAETDHIHIESEQTTYPLAPGETAYWFVDVSSLTGEEATAYTDLNVNGSFEAQINVYEENAGEVIYSESNANIFDTVVLDEFELTEGVNYVISVTAADDAPQREQINLELIVSAMGESTPITPEPPTTEEPPTDDPTDPPTDISTPPEPEDPETPERPDRPVPPELEHPEREDPVVPESERDDPTVTPEEDDTIEIPTGYAPEGPVLWGFIFAGVAGLAAIGVGAYRLLRNKKAAAAASTIAGGGNK
ncbi:hypothetical protein [Nesterenkonia alba]|uniref:hypothetical protein n=1 Tax=Nesterenkonia alba TaxID=515814 RepID=UPI0012EB3311|nr:hypothetical protein [Nesterenkonia alba]